MGVLGGYPKWGTWSPSASFFADLLLLYSAYCLPSVDGQGIRGSFHLYYPHHSGHVILWACILIYLFPLSTTCVGKFLAIFYVIVTPLLNPVIYTFRNKEIRNAIKRVWWQSVDFCWYFIISNYQKVFCELLKLATPILLLKTGKSFPIHIWKSCIYLDESFVSIL